MIFFKELLEEGLIVACRSLCSTSCCVVELSWTWRVLHILMNKAFLGHFSVRLWKRPRNRVLLLTCMCLFVCVCVCVCVCDSNLNSGLCIWKQPLYHLSHASSPFLLWLFLEMGSLDYAWLASNLDLPQLSLPSSYYHRCEPSAPAYLIFLKALGLQSAAKQAWLRYCFIYCHVESDFGFRTAHWFARSLWVELTLGALGFLR
jgi:hypothetical protein